MNKTFRKAALSTFCMLIVALVSLTGVTYAWFSSAKSASVSDFGFDVASASGGIEISLDNNDWGNSVEIVNEGTNYNPVSTVGALNGNALGFFTAALDEGDITKLTSTSATTNGYFKFSLYVRNTGGVAQAVSLTDTMITAEAQAAKSELASRIAVVTYESIDFDTEYTGAVADFNGKNALSSVIYEPNATTHTTTGKLDAQKQYAANGAAYPGDSVKYDTYGVAGANNSTISKYEPIDGVLELVDTKDLTATAFTVNAGEVLKIDVYVWLEGQDNDCDNRIAGYNFNVALNFAAEDAE